MDLFVEPTVKDPDHAMYVDHINKLVASKTIDPGPKNPEEVMALVRTLKQQDHANRFPYQELTFAHMFLIQSDLSETQYSVLLQHFAHK